MEISLFSPHLVKGRSFLNQKVQCQAIQQRKKCIASTRHKPPKNNIKPRPNLPYARDQSFAVNLFSSTFKAPPTLHKPLPPIHHLPSSSSTHSQIPNKNQTHSLPTHKKYVLQQHPHRAIPAHQDDLQHQATHWSRLRASGKNLQHQATYWCGLCAAGESL